MDINFMTLDDALAVGFSKEDLKKLFNEIIDSIEVDTDEETHRDECECRKCPHKGLCSDDDDDEEIELDIFREDMIMSVFDYLFALRAIDKNTKITDDMIDELVDIIKDLETEYLAKIAPKHAFDKNKNADDIITEFIKRLH